MSCIDWLRMILVAEYLAGSTLVVARVSGVGWLRKILVEEHQIDGALTVKCDIKCVLGRCTIKSILCHHRWH